MFVRIKGQIVNLDLIKRISDITPYKMFKSDLKVEDYHWMKIVSGGPNGEIEALNKTANGTENEREFTIVYVVDIHHYQRTRYDEDITRIVIGTSRTEARKILEALVKRLNGNINGIEEITA